jgi:hypothetical protein
MGKEKIFVGKRRLSDGRGVSRGNPRKRTEKQKVGNTGQDPGEKGDPPPGGIPAPNGFALYSENAFEIKTAVFG